ncbi:MAG: MOSC domain-containing protein [Rhodobacteraceae bacterium]|nr:MOSC domain-containing protein [Paracoccaceae bacterium]
MTPHITQIWRHPVKSHGREELVHVRLSEGKCLPWDRRWAVAHEAAEIDPDAPQWAPCANFSRGSKAPLLQAITARCNLPAQQVTFSHPALKDMTIDPDNTGDIGAFIQWVMPISPANRALPARLVRVPGRGMTDTDYASVSLINLASHAEVAARIGRPVSHLRWRGNLILDGLPAWQEMQWVGRRLRVGLAELEIVEPIRRCMATAASTRTGERDADTLGALQGGWSHKDMGVYARVTRTGDVSQGDTAELL